MEACLSLLLDMGEAMVATPLTLSKLREISPPWLTMDIRTPMVADLRRVVAST